MRIYHEYACDDDECVLSACWARKVWQGHMSLDNRYNVAI